MTTNKAAQQLSLVCKDVKAIAKNKTNSQGSGFKYRGVDDFMNNIGPVFRTHGLTLIIEQFLCEVTTSNRTNQYGKEVEWTKVKLGTNYSVIADDGSTVCIAKIFSEALDNSDKAIPKAMSMALKNMLSQVFLVPTEDTHDPDETTPEIEAPRQSQQFKPQNSAPKVEMAKADEIKRFFALAKQKLISIEDIKEFMALEFGIESTADMTKLQLDALGILVQNDQFKQALQSARDRKLVK